MSDKPKKTKAPKAVNTPEQSTATATKSVGDRMREAAEKRRTIAKEDLFVFVKNPEKPVAPQATTIVNTIAAHPQGIKRDDLVEALKTALTTRQPPARILTYYQAQLVEAGLIRVDNPNRKPKESAPETAPSGGEDQTGE